MNIVAPWLMFGAAVAVLSFLAHKNWIKYSKSKGHQEHVENPRKAA